jgi:hypothetical protein
LAHFLFGGGRKKRVAESGCGTGLVRKNIYVVVPILIHHAVRGALKPINTLLLFCLFAILIHHAVRGALKLPNINLHPAQCSDFNPSCS